MPVLSGAQLDKLFPFFVSFDPELTILALGRSLRKLVAEPDTRRSLLELMTIERPLLKAPSFPAIVQRAGTLAVFALRERSLRLRGEVLQTEEGALFVGTPWVQSVADLQSAGLTLKDLAVHDLTGDLLVMLRTMQTSMEETVQATDRLRTEAALREAALNDLESKLQIIEQQRQTLDVLSVPIIRLWDGVLAVPVLGAVDAERSNQLMERLLSAVQEQRAEFAILDVTGVGSLTSETARHFIRLLRAVSLIGAQGLISGIGATLARSLNSLDVDLSELRSFASLREALSYSLSHTTKRR